MQMIEREKEWLCFYHPDGRLIFSKPVSGVFGFEAQAIKMRLAAEYDCKVYEIKTRLQNEPPEEAEEVDD